MNAAAARARDAMVARGFTEAEAITLLCPVIGAAYRRAAGHARARSNSSWGAASASPSTILCTVSDELYAIADEFDPATPGSMPASGGPDDKPEEEPAP